MKRTVWYHIVVGIALINLSSCTRIVDWGKDTFNQGQKRSNKAQEVRQYIRSVTAYDQFSTSAIFDALWLSGDVRTIYANMHARRHGKTDEQHKAFLRRQLEETNHYVSFYVLSLFEVPLSGDEEIEWTPFLQIGDTNIAPIEVKTIDLPYEYRVFFGARVSRFKLAYIMKFDAHAFDGEHILHGEHDKISLHIRSARKEAVLEWLIDAQGNAIANPKNIDRYAIQPHK